jgi:gluconolactonase
VIKISFVSPGTGHLLVIDFWVGCAGLGGMLEIDPRGVILGFVAIPNGDAATTNFAFGGPDN